MPTTPSSNQATAASAATITQHELQQCSRANATGLQPIVFVHAGIAVIGFLTLLGAVVGAI